MKKVSNLTLEYLQNQSIAFKVAQPGTPGPLFLTRVILLGLIVAIGAWLLFMGLRAINASSLVVPTGTTLAGGMLSVALIFGRRQYDFKGLLSPLSINASVLFASAWTIVLLYTSVRSTLD